MEKQTDMNKKLKKIFKEGEAESFFPGYLVNEIEDFCDEVIITMSTSTEDSPEAVMFKKFTEESNITISVYDDVVYISCLGADEDFEEFSMNFTWDGTEKNFKEQLDINLKELGYIPLF